MLIAGRAIQGVGGAIFPLAFGIIRDEFPRERVATGIGLISATFGIGGGAGLVLSGLIVDHLAYEWIFWLALVVDRDRDRRHAPVRARVAGQDARRKIDWVGAALLSVGLGVAAARRQRGQRLGLGVAARSLGLFARRGRSCSRPGCAFELRAPQPLVDMRMMRRRGVWTTNLTGAAGRLRDVRLVHPHPAARPAARRAGFGFGATVTAGGRLPAPLGARDAGRRAGRRHARDRYGSRCRC